MVKGIDFSGSFQLHDSVISLGGSIICITVFSYSSNNYKVVSLSMGDVEK